jgi:hypothetical protein
MNAVEEHDDYFVQKRNAAGTLGLSCLQKVTAAFKMLAYGVPANASTALQCLRRFVVVVVEVFDSEYLRLPNEQDTVRLLAVSESIYFPGMLGSIDCMHWGWKNYPTAWQNVHGHKKEPTIILEAVAFKDLWIWHAFFRMPGSHNDINVLQWSSIFVRLVECQGLQVNYTINDNDYLIGYYLVYGIYLSWATFMKTIFELQGNKKKYFAKTQEACRKNVERAFRVLQSCFAIVCGSARLWDEDSLGNIMMACITMHNMIVEDELEEEDFNYEQIGEKGTVSHDDVPELDAFIANYQKIKDNETHTQLQSDLVEHL